MESIQEKKRISRSAWLIVLCWLVYTCSYLGKLGYNANITQIEADYRITHAQSGLVSTFFFVAYGVGQVVNGLLCKKYPLRFAVLGGLLLSGAMNLAVGFASSFAFVKYLWLINGAALSVLWPSLVRLLSETLAPKERGKAVLVMGTTVATGTLFVYGFSALFVALGAYKTMFIVAGVLLPSIAIIWFFAYPRLTGRKESREERTVQPLSTERKAGMPGLWIPICIFAGFAVINNLVKDGLTTWVPSILKDTYNLPDYLSILLTLFLPICAVFGSSLVVLLRKKIHSFVLLCAFLFFTSACSIGTVIAFLSTDLFVITLCAFALVSCLMAGVNNAVTSMIPMYWKDKVNSGMLAGVLNGFCYAGSALSSFGLGLVADEWGWTVTFWLLFSLCALAVVVGAIYALVQRKKKISVL